MKRALILISLLLTLIPLGAMAAHFKCDLTLNVIENTSSSEYKQLAFDIDLKSSLKNVMTGTLTTSTCFNSFIDPFTTDSSEFKQINIGDQMMGTIRNKDLIIGKNHFQLALSYSQIPAGPIDDGVVTFEANGKVLSLDNEFYIHQNIIGECYLSEEPLITPKKVNLPDMGCSQ